MSTLHIEAQVSLDALLRAVEQLSLPELEQFAAQVLTLQARRKAPGLSKEETDLLLLINRGVPPNVQARYDELTARRRAETLTPEEHDDLLCLTDQIEKLDAERMAHLARLARLRGSSLSALMNQLGIEPPAYA